MTIRDTAFPATGNDLVFLEYHGNSPWAQAMVVRGLRLNPEAVTYMQREVAERARAKAEYEKNIAESDNAEQSAETPAPGTDAKRDAGANDPGGPERPQE